MFSCSHWICFTQSISGESGQIHCFSRQLRDDRNVFVYDYFFVIDSTHLNHDAMAMIIKLCTYSGTIHNPNNWKNKSGTIGSVLPSTMAKIIASDGTGRSVAQGPNKFGELIVKGPQVS